MAEEVKPLFQNGIPPYSPRRRNSLSHIPVSNTYALNGTSPNLSTTSGSVQGATNTSTTTQQHNFEGSSSLPQLFYLHQNHGSRSSLHSGNAFNHSAETVEHHTVPHTDPQIPTIDYQPSQFFQLVPFFNGESDNGSSMALVPVSPESIRKSLDGDARPHSWAVPKSNKNHLNNYRTGGPHQSTYHSNMRQRPQSMDSRWAPRRFDHERAFDYEEPSSHIVPQNHNANISAPVKFEPPHERDWELPNSNHKRSILKRIKYRIKKLFNGKSSSSTKDRNLESAHLNSFTSPTELEKPPNRSLNSNSETALHHMYRPASRYRNSRGFDTFPEE